MHIEVRDLKINYDVVGSKEPIILIHGNGENLEIFDALTAKLKDHFQVYRLDSRDHGQTTHTHTYRYDVMADDVYAFICKMNIKNPYILGFSDGGIIAMMLEIKHPNISKGLILLGSNTRPKGMRYKVIKAMRRIYNNTKNPLYLMMLTQPFIKKHELRTIQVPTLIVVGEKDLILKKHTHMMHRQIKFSQTLVMSGYRHEDYITNQDVLFEPLMDWFNEMK